MGLGPSVLGGVVGRGLQLEQFQHAGCGDSVDAADVEHGHRELAASDKLVCQGCAQPEGSSCRDDVDHGRQHEHLLPGQRGSHLFLARNKLNVARLLGHLMRSFRRWRAGPSGPDAGGPTIPSWVISDPFLCVHEFDPRRRCHAVAAADGLVPARDLAQQAAGDEGCLCAGECAGRVELQTGVLGDDQQARPAATIWWLSVACSRSRRIATCIREVDSSIICLLPSTTAQRRG